MAAQLSTSAVVTAALRHDLRGRPERHLVGIAASVRGRRSPGKPGDTDAH